MGNAGNGCGRLSEYKDLNRQDELVLRSNRRPFETDTSRAKLVILEAWGKEP